MTLLLRMGLAGAVLAGVVTVVRALALHRMPKGALLALWALALARFLLPVTVPAPFSAYTLASAVVVSEAAVARKAAPVSPAPPEALPVVTEGQAAPSAGPLPVLPLVWAMGTAGCALFFLSVSLRCRREFRSSLPVTQAVVGEWLAAHPLRRAVTARACDRISAPLTFGIFRPVILLPKGFDYSDSRQLDLVLTHEWVHIRRFDGLTKLLIVSAVCLHWWNPMAWVLYVLFNRDLELACDEAVVHRCGSRAEYARALIRLEERKSGLAPFSSSFSRNAMEERILAIMKTKKITRRTAALSAAAVFAVGALFATSAAVGPGAVTTASIRDTGDGPAYPFPISRVNWDGERELLESFEPFGISYDSDGKICFNGERVRWFWDGYEIWEDGTLLGWSMRYEYLDEDGTVDVRTLHGTICNSDGSRDLYGPLIDIVAYSQEEFDSRTCESIRRTSEATTMADDAVLVEDDASPGTGEIEVIYADETAVQEVTGVFTDSVETVYEGTAVKAQGSGPELSAAAEGTYTTGSGDTALGRTFAEIFAGYRAYGITCREKDAVREVFYNGEPVAQFVDIRPDGSVFTFSPIGGAPGTLTVRTVYDSAGRLTGVEPV